MKIWSPHLYISQGIADGVSPDVLNSAVATAKKLRYLDLPPVFTLKHLSVLSGVSYSSLRFIVQRRDPSSNYKTFKLKKSNAGFHPDRVRFISVPEPSLLIVQKWIHEHILKKIPHSKSTMAFHADGGILKAAIPHCGNNWMIKIDIKNYFESISEVKVYDAFVQAGYQPLISFEMARLCTRVRNKSNPIKMYRHDDTLGTQLPYTTVEIGHLPQGAPTSPLLSNICTKKLDASFFEFSIAHGINYTRYADDIIFSSRSFFSRDICVSLIKEIKYILNKNGFWPNEAKTKIVTPGARKIVLGLLVDGPVPKLTSEYKKEILMHLHFASRKDIGIISHCNRRGFKSVTGFLNYLEGKISFASSIEPLWARKVNATFVYIKNKYNNTI
ncbi:RNA-directed DNA polymerase [Pantoea sp. S61]|uniref:reverse transcriptase family protein n=1 Tax=Pantoea sp. S61 TaxID=2767442 RepID=UPI001909DBF3|nr:reverse transcriptase family protein [Pantoea sp. S61]MBK0123548.1 RNA-directed DNA polymerase [Pantoea sp. S61]